MKHLLIKLAGTIFFSALLFNSFDASSQRNIYVGVEGGVGLFQTKVKNYGPTIFKEQRLLKLAPTGFNLGIQVSKKIFFEVGLYEQTFTNDHVKYIGTGNSWESRSAYQDAFTTSLKLKYVNHVSKNLILSPIIGLSIMHINQPSGYFTDYSVSHSGTTISDGVSITELATQSSYYKTNSLTKGELGIEAAYQILPRLQTYGGVNFVFGKENYAQQDIIYTRTGQEAQESTIYYGGNEAHIKLGFRWFLK